MAITKAAFFRLLALFRSIRPSDDDSLPCELLIYYYYHQFAIATMLVHIVVLASLVSVVVLIFDVAGNMTRQVPFSFLSRI